jgi:hypothetical protein
MSSWTASKVARSGAGAGRVLGAAADIDEARFLTAILNSPVVTELVRPPQ